MGGIRVRIGARAGGSGKPSMESAPGVLGMLWACLSIPGTSDPGAQPPGSCRGWRCVPSSPVPRPCCPRGRAGGAARPCQRGRPRPRSARPPAAECLSLRAGDVYKSPSGVGRRWLSPSRGQGSALPSLTLKETRGELQKPQVFRKADGSSWGWALSPRRASLLSPATHEVPWVLPAPHHRAAGCTLPSVWL